MAEIIGTVTLYQGNEAQIETGHQCSECGAVGQEDDYEFDQEYECEACGAVFHRSDNDSHRCDCGKFASKSEEDHSWACPDCSDFSARPEEVQVVWLDGGDALLVQA